MSTQAHSRIATVWNRAAAPAAWLLATFAFVLGFGVRMSATSTGPQAIIGLCGIAIAVLIAVLQPVLAAKSTQKKPGRPARWAAGFLVAFLVCWAAFDSLSQAWTCPYTQDARLVVGTETTSVLRSYIAKSPSEREGHSGACRMVKEFAGATLDMYEFQGLALRYYTLVGLYLAAWLALTALVIATVELVATSAAKARGGAKT